MTRGIPPIPESIAVPGTDPVYSTVADLRTVGEAIARITNSTDQPVTVTVQTALADDPAFEYPNESGDGFAGTVDVGGISVTGFVNPTPAQVTLAPNTSTFARVSGAWAYARIKGVAAATPGEGGTLDVAWGVKHRGD